MYTHRIRLTVVVAIVCVSALLIVPTGALANGSDACCVGMRGNVDGHGIVELADLSALISYLTGGGYVPPCMDLANVNGAGITDLADLSMLIAYLTGLPVTLVPCPADTSYMTDTLRVLALQAVHQKVGTVINLPVDSFNQAMLAFVQGRPEFDSAGITPDAKNVWARFTDGVLLFISNSFGQDLDTLPGDPLPDPASEPGWESSRLAGKSYERRIPNPAILANPMDLPDLAEAKIISTLGTAHPSAGTTSRRLKSWLTDAGYTIASSGGSVADFKSIGGEGVLCYFGHGGHGPAADGTQIYGIWTTNTAATVADIAPYKADFLAKRLCYFECPLSIDSLTLKVTSAERIGITSNFISTYWGQFAPNAIVAINACASDSLAAFRNAIQSKGGPAYFGWSVSVSCKGACYATEYLFDRLLGANKAYPRENPPQRPFDVVSVFNKMVSLGIHIQPGGDSINTFTSTLRYHAGSSNFGILTPSIRFMSILEHQDTLEMNGIFGHDPGPRGKVIIGGTELPIGAWEPGLIIAFIPNTGAGSVGPVTVEIDGRKSNTVNLTEWKGVMTYQHLEAGTLKGTIAINAHFRADVHSFRDGPGMTPRTNTLHIAACEDSYGSAKAEGTFSYTEPGSDPPSTTIWDWSDSTYLPGLWEQKLDGFIMVGPLNPTAKTWDLQIVAATGQDLKEHVTYLPSGDFEDYTFGLQLFHDLADDKIFQRYHLEFDNLWNIKSGFRQAIEDCCSYNPDDPEIWHDFGWPQIPASWAPDPDAGQ
jgi:hypothetical protein